MTVTLSPVTAERFPAWLRRTRAEYEADLVATGETPEEARRQARASTDHAFPDDVPTPGHAVFDLITDEGTVAGYLWLGHDTSGDSRSWWVWDVFVEPEQRGRGVGRAAMRLAEEYARDAGAQTLGLSVFGFNEAARGLYESLGYEVTSVKMRKRL
ncbi:GNAT family N-acetyltransferase [Aeromicrobium sp. JJY06]|uniref:GNAT family N-acetyltransferase n=1 Tax=Aeromicrobium sp. JJY06 TaxID=3373478 RepID=UPI00376EEC52